MKKTVVVFYVILAAFGLMAFGLMNSKSPEAGPFDTSISDSAAITKLRTAKINKAIFSGCNYTLGPGSLERNHWGPYLSVVPAREATYEGGTEALMAYLKENSKEVRAGQAMEALQSFQLFFTVTQNGTITNIKLKGTSGYLSIDSTMIELLTKAPGKWQPAENTKGEKVAQELVVSFGPIGC